MKIVELRAAKTDFPIVEKSKFPVKDIDELCTNDEYVIVHRHKEEKHIAILRYIRDIESWYIIDIDGLNSRKMTFCVKDLLDNFYVYCLPLPKYTADYDSKQDDAESKIARRELFTYLINKYW